MRNLPKVREAAVGGTPSLLPAPESNFAQGARSVWVFYPQGLLRRPMTGSLVCPDFAGGAQPLLPHLRQGVTSMHEISEAVPYPGHSLFQESFFFCTIKQVGDICGAGDIYVEIGVDGASRMAFAKIYSMRNPMNAVDLLRDRVVPFFEKHGVGIERVFTPGSDEYCGLAPVHPFETFLSASQIQHVQMDRYGRAANSPCQEFFHVLQAEFFTPALRKRFQQSLATLQHDLDAFVEAHNSLRKDVGTNAQERPPLRAFLDAARS